VQHWSRAALLPFADAIVETQQVGEALRVLEGGALALGALGKGEGQAQFRQRAHTWPPMRQSPGYRGEDVSGTFSELPSFQSQSSARTEGMGPSLTSTLP
jgi:hypothetical protein